MFCMLAVLYQSSSGSYDNDPCSAISPLCMRVSVLVTTFEKMTFDLDVLHDGLLDQST